MLYKNKMNIDMFILRKTVLKKISCFVLSILTCGCACIGDRAATSIIAKNKAIAYVCGIYNKVPHELEHEYYIRSSTTNSHGVIVSFYKRERFPHANSILTAPAMLGGYPSYFTIIVDKNGRLISTRMSTK
jgi:hypothetical protein